MNQNQYDACIRDCYQKGENIWAQQGRAITKFILSNNDFDDYEKVLEAFLDGEPDLGRSNRRTKEANLFCYCTYLASPNN